MRVLALDSGATITGLCYGEDSPYLVAAIQMPKLPLIDRLVFLRERILHFIDYEKILPERILVEWPPFMVHRPGQAQVYAAAGVIIGVLGELAPIDLVYPSAWKKVICHNGNATKDLIKRTILDRWPDLSDKLKQDCYDAIGLWMFGVIDK